MEGGQELDVRNLLQLMDNGGIDRIVYNLDTQHPPNGFYDTPAFKRIRSEEMASTRRIRLNSGSHRVKKSRLRTSNAGKKAGTQNPRVGQQRGGKGEVAQHGRKEKKGKVKPRSATPMP